MKELSVVDSLMGLVSSEYNEVKSSVFRALAALADGDGMLTNTIITTIPF